MTSRGHLDETRSWHKNVVPKLFRLPVKSSLHVPLLKNPTPPLLSAKYHPLPLHPSSSYVLGQGCFSLISELSAQTSLKSLLPRAKVTLLLPGEANSFLWSMAPKLSRRSQLATCKPNPAPRPILLGSQRVGIENLIFYNFELLTNTEKSEAFTEKFQLFSFSWNLESSGNLSLHPMSLSWLELSGGWSLEKGCWILPQSPPFPGVSSHCASESVLHHWLLRIVLLIEELKGQENRSHTHLSSKGRETKKDQGGVITKQKLNTYMRDSVVKNPPAKESLGSIPRSGRSPGEGNGNPLQYSSLEIPWTEEPDRLQSKGSQKS